MSQAFVFCVLAVVAVEREVELLMVVHHLLEVL
jgi:hypothetical protein